MKKKILAVDIGGTFIKSALIDSEGKIYKREKTPTQAQESKEVVLANLKKAFDKVYEPGVSGLGLGSPGCIDPKKGSVNAVENIPCLNGLSLTDFFKREYKIPAAIDNDANNAAKGEYLFGAGQKKRNFMGLTLGTGVGGGLVLDGSFHRGVNNYAGEIGHMVYIPDGAPCTCGKRGCLEAYASATAIIRSAQSMLKRGLPTKLKKHDPKEIDSKLICDLAKEGDAICLSIIQDVAKALGVVLGSAINLLNLECLVLGGGISAAGDVLFEPLRLYASRQTLPMAYERCTILPSKLGNDAGLLGCAASALMPEEEKKSSL